MVTPELKARVQQRIAQGITPTDLAAQLAIDGVSAADIQEVMAPFDAAHEPSLHQSVHTASLLHLIHETFQILRKNALVFLLLGIFGCVLLLFCIGILTGVLAIPIVLSKLPYSSLLVFLLYTLCNVFLLPLLQLLIPLSFQYVALHPDEKVGSKQAFTHGLKSLVRAWQAEVWIMYICTGTLALLFVPIVILLLLFSSFHQKFSFISSAGLLAAAAVGVFVLFFMLVYLYWFSLSGLVILDSGRRAFDALMQSKAYIRTKFFTTFRLLVIPYGILVGLIGIIILTSKKIPLPILDGAIGGVLLFGSIFFLVYLAVIYANLRTQNLTNKFPGRMEQRIYKLFAFLGICVHVGIFAFFIFIFFRNPQLFNMLRNNNRRQQTYSYPRTIHSKLGYSISLPVGYSFDASLPYRITTLPINEEYPDQHDEIIKNNTLVHIPSLTNNGDYGDRFFGISIMTYPNTNHYTLLGLLPSYSHLVSAAQALNNHKFQAVTPSQTMLMNRRWYVLPGWGDNPMTEYLTQLGDGGKILVMYFVTPDKNINTMAFFPLLNNMTIDPKYTDPFTNWKRVTINNAFSFQIPKSATITSANGKTTITNLSSGAVLTITPDLSGQPVSNVISHEEKRLPTFTQSVDSLICNGAPLSCMQLINSSTTPYGFELIAQTPSGVVILSSSHNTISEPELTIMSTLVSGKE